MKLVLTEKQEELKQKVREFVEKEIKPVASINEQNAEYPEEIVKKASQLGLMGICIPEEYGGMGLDHVSYAVAMEEISRGDASTGVILSVNNSLVCDAIHRFGTEEQKKKYLTKLAKGECLGAFALTEANAGSDAGAIQSTAVLEGNEYILNGTKIFTTNGPQADIFLTFALTEPLQGSKGMSAFIVERKNKGVSIGSKEDKLGIRASGTSEVLFESAPVPRENLLGTEGAGFKIALATLDYGRIGIGAQAVGIAQAAFEEAVKYSVKREQFGKPISEFQAVQWMLANMAVKIDAARLVLYRGAYAADTGKRFSKEASMAKLFASETAMEVTQTAIQVLGGYGYTTDSIVERLYRDAKITQIYEGTSEIERIVISRNLIGGG